MNDDELYKLEKLVFAINKYDHELMQELSEGTTLLVCLDQQFWGEFFSEVR